MEKKETQITRIEDMERRLDVCAEATRSLSDALDAFAKALPALQALDQYYRGGDWLRDYAADEAGAFPPDLKRGVLSQDALGDLLDDVRDAARDMDRLNDELKVRGLAGPSMQ